jgi:hypothetical protein
MNQPRCDDDNQSDHDDIDIGDNAPSDVSYAIAFAGVLSPYDATTSVGRALSVKTDNSTYSAICVRRAGSICNCGDLVGAAAGSHIAAGTASPLSYTIQAGAEGVYSVVVMRHGPNHLVPTPAPGVGSLNVGS